MTAVPPPAPGAPGVKFAWVEAARGIAALAVVLMHAGNLMNVPQFSGHIGLGGFFNFGYVGVDFFFVLSGFVITHSHGADIGRPQRVGHYLWRRATRIFPIYWISLALAAAVVLGGRALLGSGAAEPAWGWRELLSTVLLLPLGEPRFLGVAWSLQYEVMFYALFALALLHRGAALLGLALWFAGLLLHAAGLVPADAAGLISASTLQFVMGAGLAVWLRSHDAHRHVLAGLCLALLALAAAIAVERFVMPQPHQALGHVLLGLASVALIHALVGLDRTRRAVAPPALVALGAVSYAVYLNHITFIALTYKLLQVSGLYARLPEALLYAVAVSVALGLSVALGRWVELPLVAWFKRQRPARSG